MYFVPLHALPSSFSLWQREISPINVQEYFKTQKNFQSFKGNQGAKKNHIIHYTCHAVPLTHGRGIVSLPDAMTCSVVLLPLSTNMKTSNVSCIWLFICWQSLWLYLRGISILIFFKKKTIFICACNCVPI